MNIKKAEFITSLAKINNYVDYDMPEIAFVGRSNVGKSSLINALTNRNKLAKTSSMPGRTRLVNYFLINDRFMLVDLPGYGFAVASKEAQKEWQTLISGYLQRSNNLKMVFVLVDIRITPSELDKQMLEYLYYYNIPFKVIATKTDKIGKTKINAQVQIIATELGLGTADIIPVSASGKANLGAVLDFMDSVLDYEKLHIDKAKISAIKEKDKPQGIVVGSGENISEIVLREEERKKNDAKLKNKATKAKTNGAKTDGKVSKKATSSKFGNSKMNNKNVAPKIPKRKNEKNAKLSTASDKTKKNNEKSKETKVKNTPRYVLKKRKAKK